MRFGYLLTVLLYTMTTISFGACGSSAYAQRNGGDQTAEAVGVGVDIVDSCLLGVAIPCSAQTTQPVKTCMLERGMPCIETVGGGALTLLAPLLGQLLHTDTFRSAGHSASGAATAGATGADCVDRLDSEASALRCIRGVPTRPGSHCIAEDVGDCLRLSGQPSLRIVLASEPPTASPPTSPSSPQTKAPQD